MQRQASLLNELERSFRQGDATRRDEIVTKIGQLFVASAEAYSPEQIELFGEVLTRLVEEIGIAARAELSRTLCHAPTGPSNLLRRLALDDAVEVAEPLLSGFDSLDENVLVECATLRGQEHLLAISCRHSLSEAVTAPLVDRGNAGVLQSVVNNSGASFSDASFRTLVGRSTGNDTLGRALGARLDLPRHHFLKLLTVASDCVRRELQTLDPLNSGMIANVVSGVTESIAASTLDASESYEEAIAYARQLHQAGKLGDLQILKFAEAAQTERAVAAIAVLSKLEISEVETILRQDRFEAMLMLVRGLGLGWPTAKALLKIQAGIAGVSSARVERALAIFERIDRATAEKVLILKRRSKRD